MTVATKRVDNVIYLPTSPRYAEIPAKEPQKSDSSDHPDSFTIASRGLKRFVDPKSLQLDNSESDVFDIFASSNSDELSARRAMATFIQQREEAYDMIDAYNENPSPRLRTELNKRLRFFMPGIVSPHTKARIDSLALTSQAIESLIITGSSITIIDHAYDVKAAATDFLDTPSYEKLHADAAIALQRIIPALSREDRDAVSHKLFGIYTARIGNQHTDENIGVLQATVALMKVVDSTAEFDYQTMRGILAEASLRGESDDVRHLAYEAHEELMNKLPANIIANDTTAIGAATYIGNGIPPLLKPPTPVA